MMAIPDIRHRLRGADAELPRPPFDNKGGGDDGGMEARISVLEAANIETRDRLARIETRLDSVATKADLLNVRAALHQEMNAQTWKLVTFVCGFGTALVAATYFVAKHVY
ncbi:hypothetical protein DWV00_11600 [Trinickia dinghuensis]|uniref:Uncharacterized protein n=2 Tax=Trinickia dinghuensis TaxID=2291023 RepID=A0A3D8K1B0_9BURK|nr:hypothetical protein DWV00_11600 [Trinickia dinghuensis]